MAAKISGKSKAYRIGASKQQPCRVVVVGETLAASMEAARDPTGQLDLVASFDNNTTFQAQLNTLKADTLVIEQQTLHVDTAIM